MSFQESERKSESDRNTSIPEFGNTDIPVLEVNPFSQVDQAEGFDIEEQENVYYEESDIDADEHDEYEGLSLDKCFDLLQNKT